MTIDIYKEIDPDTDARLVFTYVSGGNALTGAVWTVHIDTPTYTTQFTMSTTNPAAAANVSSVVASNGASGSALPEGVYGVQLLYTSGYCSCPATLASRVVTIDRTTRSPVMSSPTNFTPVMTDFPLSLSYTLPEAAAADSVTLTFIGSSSMRVLQLAPAEETAGAHSFTIDPKTPLPSAHIDSVTGGITDAVPEGLHSVILSYQDMLGNPAATAIAAGVLVDTVTAAPILGQPAGGSPYPDAIPVSYTLPELANTNTVKLTFTGPVTRRVVMADHNAGTHTTTLDPDNLAASPQVTSTPDGNTLPGGTYAVQLEYQDSRGNPVAAVITSGVELGPLPTTTVTVTTTVPSTTTVTQTTTVTEATTITEATEIPVTVTRTTPTPPVTLAPKPDNLLAAWSTKKAKGRWTLRASFKPQPGAETYDLTATSGKRRARGTCRITGTGTKQRVVCSAAVKNSGIWALTAVARGTGTAVIAQASKTLRLR